jgi:hypothetical protein
MELPPEGDGFNKARPLGGDIKALPELANRMQLAPRRENALSFIRMLYRFGVMFYMPMKDEWTWNNGVMWELCEKKVSAG